MVSSVGMYVGNIINGGSITVKAGMRKNRFETWECRRVFMSLVLKRVMRDAVKNIHSARMFVRLVIPIPMP